MPSAFLDARTNTQDAWKQDSRSQEDIGLAVEIDPDGKAATLDADSLTGYGVSKPLRIGAQVGFTLEERFVTDAAAALSLKIVTAVDSSMLKLSPCFLGGTQSLVYHLPGDWFHALVTFCPVDSCVRATPSEATIQVFWCFGDGSVKSRCTLAHWIPPTTSRSQASVGCVGSPSV